VQIETKPSREIRERRAKIERDVKAFLKAGGKVDQLDKHRPATKTKPRFNAGCIGNTESA